MPWFRSCMSRGAVDMIFSQEVMEHVDRLSDAYKMMASLLKPGGYASHRINFDSHDPASKNWNDHWTIGYVAWRMRWVRLIWMINRVPLSGHVDLMRRHGFRIVSLTRHKDSKGSVRQSLLRGRFRGMSEDDLTTRRANILARLEIL